MTASEPTPPTASPSPAAPLASQLAANPCSHPSFDQFVATIAALRAPDGCPWDRTQTHQSIAHNMIEEAYEAVDAIEAADVAHLREELGDVLLQVVLQSQIASDAGEFDIDDVCADVNEKMVRRHPHVFGEAQAANAGDVLDLWDRVKMAEKGAADEAADGAGERREGLLDGVPTSFPALMQAQKISRKAAAAGFEWDSLDGVWEKVREEIAELQEAYAVAPKAANGKVDAAAVSSDAAVDPAAAEAAVAAVEDELGDVLFSLVNVGRRMGVDAEGALRSTCRKFRDRWAWMEQAAWQQGRTIEDLSGDERETLWEEAKKRERS
ncbi:MAG: nucleoside triphosphate pyrophosphohydrolase [Eggerthella lenta]|nr:nucleoside triphosphate pyrophosphohydrolase [Eggerthella lenta]